MKKSCPTQYRLFITVLKLGYFTSYRLSFDFFFLFSKQRGLPIQHKKYFLENWKRTKEGVSNKQIIISLFCLKHTIHAN
jgi:hypothetical protein